MYYQLQSCNLDQLLIKYIAKNFIALINPSFGLVTHKLVAFLQTINVLNAYQGIFYQGNFCLILLQTLAFFEGLKAIKTAVLWWFIFFDIQIQACTNQK